MYVGTTWGCIVVAEAESMRPITVFRPYEDEVRAIVPLPPLSIHNHPLLSTQHQDSISSSDSMEDIRQLGGYDNPDNGK